MSTPSPAIPVRRGRPRDSSRDDALRSAALEVLAEVGYRAMTMDAVAARARAGKATIYRRWESKLDLVVDTCSRSVLSTEPLPDTGTVEGDLRAAIDRAAAQLCGPIGRAAQALVGELPHEPELAATVRGTVLAAQQNVVETVLNRAVSRGALTSDAPVTQVAELAGAVLAHRSMLTGRGLDRRFLDGLVDEVLLPLLGSST